jgi:hypothetical protein
MNRRVYLAGFLLPAKYAKEREKEIQKYCSCLFASFAGKISSVYGITDLPSRYVAIDRSLFADAAA